MDLAAYLDQQLRAAAIPIVSVKVSSPTDRSQWIVQFDPSATQAQKDQAATLVATVVWDGPTIADQDAQLQVDAKAIKAAVITSLWGRLNRQPTAAEISAERSRFIAIYKQLA